MILHQTVDHIAVALYIVAMAKKKSEINDESELVRLENSVNELIVVCKHLQKENDQLHKQIDRLNAEQAKLAGRKELAQNKVTQMIQRLKSLEVEL